jgi:DNA-binding IclR family transcriptional regulator
MDIVEYIGASTEGVTPTQIATALGLPKSTVSRLLSVLTARGWVTRLAGGETILAMKLLQLPGTSRMRDLTELTCDALRALRDSTGETSILAVLDQFDVRYLARFENHSSHVRVAAQAGALYPAHATAVGVVLLAGLSPAEWARYIKKARLEPFTPRTLTDVDELERHVATVRRQRHAVDEGGFEQGLWCVAAPVIVADTIVAALGIAVPEQRAAGREAELTAAVIEAATSSSAVWWTEGDHLRYDTDAPESDGNGPDQ